MQYFTKTQACRLLGTTMPTLNKCMKKLREQGHDITPMRDAYNPHLALLSEEQIAAIRTFMLGYRERLQVKSVPLPPATPLPSLPPAESKRSASQGYAGGSTLPDGWVTYKQMCLRHGVSERTGDRAMLKKRFTITDDRVFYVNGVEVKRTMSPEQQQAFLEWVQTRH